MGRTIDQEKPIPKPGETVCDGCFEVTTTREIGVGSILNTYRQHGCVRNAKSNWQMKWFRNKTSDYNI